MLSLDSYRPLQRQLKETEKKEELGDLWGNSKSWAHVRHTQDCELDSQHYMTSWAPPDVVLVTLSLLERYPNQLKKKKMELGKKVMWGSCRWEHPVF